VDETSQHRRPPIGEHVAPHGCVVESNELAQRLEWRSPGYQK
jgi:hypothetical protein